MRLLILLCTLLVTQAEKLDDHGSLRTGLQGLLPSSFALGGQPSASRTGSSTVHAHLSPTGISQHSHFHSDQDISAAPLPGISTVHAHVLPTSFDQHQTSRQTGLGQTFKHTDQGSSTASGISSINTHFSGTPGHSRGTARPTERCPKGQVHQFFGGPCVTPRVIKNFLLYEEPKGHPHGTPSRVNIPQPTVEYNYHFIRAQKKDEEEDHIIIPPPQKKHVIFVLNKEVDHHEREIIRLPESEAHKPEIIFINYAEGETPILPDGIDFHDALRSAIRAESRVIDPHDQQGSSHESDSLGGTHGTTTGHVSDTGSHSSEGLLLDIRSVGFGGNDFGANDFGLTLDSDYEHSR